MFLRFTNICANSKTKNNLKIITMLTKTDGRSVSNTDLAIMQSNNSPVIQAAQAISNTQGVIDLSGGEMIGGINIPSNINVIVKSIAGTGAVKKTILLFNNELFGEVISDNGSGAASIKTSFGDNLNGKIYSQLFTVLNNSNGMTVKGMTVKAKQISTGTPAPEFFTESNLKVLLNDGQGSTIPFPINIDEASRNTQFKDGELTIKKPITFNSLMQFALDIEPDIQVAFLFFTNASNSSL